MISLHGNVQGRPAIPHPSYPRFIALLDVLGMKAWLDKDSAQTIAEALDMALVACEQSSCGRTAEGVIYGPVIDVIHFSDTLIAWSPDDSWASFGAICSSLKLIVGVALTHGVPLRGSIAHGEVVCNRNTLKFVGRPIAEAYLWAEKERPFKSVGVDLTPQTISKLATRIGAQPIPAHWRKDISPRVIGREVEAAEDFMWHAECLFINHWNHGMFVRSDPKKMFLMRELPVPANEQAAVAAKLRELQAFYEHHQELQRRRSEEMGRHGGNDVRAHIEDFRLQQSDYVALDRLRLARYLGH